MKRLHSVTERRLFATKRLPSVTERRLSVTKRLPSVTERRLFVTERLHSVTERRLSVTKRRLSVMERLPFVYKKRQLGAKTVEMDRKRQKTGFFEIQSWPRTSVRPECRSRGDETQIKLETPHVVTYSINEDEDGGTLCRLHHILKLLIRRVRRFELGVHVRRRFQEAQEQTALDRVIHILRERAAHGQCG